jgi:murein DD-endopeptidase MepM/ murein hydrolase activator NlpD
MSSNKTSVFCKPGVIWRCGPCVVLGATLLLAACSNNVSRFDYSGFSDSNGDNNLTTSSLHPIPAESVYTGGSSSNSTTVVRQDLPPPSQTQPPQYAYAQPSGVQRAPLPPRTSYPAPPAYQPPPPLQASYQQPAPPPPPPASKKVTIRSGDTLSKLSRAHGVSVDDIMSANNMRSTRLSVGQELVIPLSGAPAAPKGPSKSYIVARGDSVSKIARAHDVSPDMLIEANDLRRPYTLSVGQELKIPGAAVSVAAKQKREPVRVASRGANIPLPSTRPEASLAPRSSAPLDRPRQKVAARTKSLPKPEPMAGNQFRWPVRGRIIEGFGPKASGKHNDGINVAVPKGTSIKAAENGVVAYAGSELGPYGNLVLIRHANNWVTAYAHNDELLVKRGDTVRRGEIIAKAGQSGNVSQPQLHFELRKGSKPVDPLSYMANSS